ncbi:MAG: response regulator transcription factor [Promethearchaeota archaeon]
MQYPWISTIYYPGLLLAKGIRLLAQGLTTKQIGQQLNISSTTVITHRNNLRDKLSCKNCPELIYRATQIGLLL